MGLIVLEAAVALAIIIIGVKWTMFPSKDEGPPPGPDEAPGASPQGAQDASLGGQKKDIG